jgi:excisionase family DNA binding protein
VSRQVPGYWTVAELAEAAGVTEHTIRHHCRVGHISALGLGNAWLIPDHAADEWLARRRYEDER